MKTKQRFLMQQIINILLDNNTASVRSMAHLLNTSESNIRRKLNELDDILIQEKLGKIIKTPRRGISLVNADKARLYSFFNSCEPKDLVHGETQIYHYLILILSQGNNRITIAQLSEKIYDSIPVCKKNLMICAQWLAMFGIELKIRKNVGIYLEGREENFRLAIKHIIINNPLYSVEDSIKLFAKGIDLTLLKMCITDIEKEWNFHFTEESFNSMLLYAALAITRSGFSLIELSEEECKIVLKYNEYNWSKSLFAQIEKRFLVHIDHDEIVYFAIQLLCSNLIHPSSIENGQAYLYDAKLKEFVTKIISVMSDILNIDLSEDSELYYGLLNHIRPAIFRMRFEKHSTKNLTDFIQEEYKQTYRVSWALSILFEEYYQINISSTELSYITLYIQASLDRIATPVKIMLVTEFGMGLNQMFCNKIRMAVPKVEKITIVSLHDFKLQQCKDYNLIVTTSNLEVLDERIVYISSILSENGINEIKSKLESMKHSRLTDKKRFDVSCHNLFDPNLILIKPQIETKEALIQLMADQLYSMGHITPKYLETIMKREQTVSTYIGNGVAIPHGFQHYVNESKVVVATLDKPLKWNEENDVILVFLLALRIDDENDSKKVQTFYKSFLELIDTDDDLNFILGLERNELYKYLIR